MIHDIKQMEYLMIAYYNKLHYRDEFSMVSALVCMVTHWTGLIISYNLRLSSSHDLTKLLHYVVSKH